MGGGASGAAASRCPTARGRGPEPGFPVDSELRSLQDREVHPRPTRASHVIEVFQNVRGCSTCRLALPRALADPRVCVWSALARGPRRYRCHHCKHLVTRTFGSEGYSQRSCPHAHSDAVCRRSEQRTGEEQRCLWMQETTARTPTLSGEGQGTVGRGQLGGKSGCGGRGGLPSLSAWICCLLHGGFAWQARCPHGTVPLQTPGVPAAWRTPAPEPAVYLGTVVPPEGFFRAVRPGDWEQGRGNESLVGTAVR